MKRIDKNEVKQDLGRLFATVSITSKTSVDRVVDKIYQNKDRYQAIAAAIGCPWYLVGIIHNLESSMNFNTHLHNGDSLKRKTHNVPANRPPGKPPFTFEESAIDALRMKNWHNIKDWSIEEILYRLEQYNGWGYRKYHSHVKSPYLWSKTNHYTSGKYVSDGKWSNSAVSAQVGGAAVMYIIINKIKKEGN